MKKTLRIYQETQLRLRALLLIIFILLTPNFAYGFTIATASEGGNYHPVGEAIFKILKQNKEGVKVTNGSVDNIKRLIAGTNDFAIIQNDVLLKAKTDGIEGAQELKILLALFPEYIQILVREDSEINSVFNLQNKKVYIGKDDSGNKANALDILGFFKIKQNEINLVYEEEGSSVAIEKLLDKKDKSIDAIFITSGAMNLDSRLKLVSIDKEMIRRIKNENPYYSYENKLIRGNKVNVLFTRAVLVARTPESQYGLSRKDAYDFTKAIYENQLKIEKEVKKDVNQRLSFFRRDIMVRKVSADLHSGAEQYFSEEGILASTDWRYWFALIFLLLISISIVLDQLTVRFPWLTRIRENDFIQKCYHRPAFRNCWNFVIKYISGSGFAIAFWVFLTFLMLDAIMISHFEKQYSMHFDVENPFAGKPLFEIIYWLMAFAVAGYSQGIFPNHYFGKLGAIILPVLTVLGVVFLLVHQIIQKNRRYEKELKGVLVPKLKNYVLICGWNDRVPTIIQQITSSFAPRNDQKVLVIAEIEGDKPLEKFNFKPGRVYYYKGISSDYEVLKKINLQKCSRAVVVADSKKIKRNNFRSVFTATALKEVRKETGDEGISVIAELYFPENKPFFIESGVKKLVCLHQIPARMIAHACLNPGISDILLKLLSVDSFCHAQMIPASHPSLSSMRNVFLQRDFKSALLGLRKHNMLLLAVYKGDEKTEHEPLELEFRENSPYVVNPFGSDKNYTIQETDQILVVKNNYVSDEHSQPEDIKVNSNVFQNDKGTSFISKSENIMVIGNIEMAKLIMETIAPFCESLYYITTEKTKTSDPACAYKTIPSESFEDKFIENNKDLLNKITRVIILAPERKGDEEEHAVYLDDQTMMVAKKLLSQFKKGLNKSSLHILAEMRHENNLNLFHDIGISQPVPTNQLIELILAQMIFHEGLVSEFFLKAMSYSSENKKACLEKWSSFKLQKIMGDVIGNDYDSILEKCLNKNIQLLAIEKQDGKIVLNPTKKSEKGTCLEPNDFVYSFVPPRQFS